MLGAAIDVLKADGYAGLTVAKVAAGADESKALIAYHFGSKQGLVAAAGRAVAEEITERLLAAIERATSVEAVVRGVLEEVEGIVDDDPRLARIYFDLAAVSVVDDEVRATIREINEQWRGVISGLLSKAEDGPSPARSRTITALLIAAAQGLALERIDRGPIGELKDARELLVEAIVRS
jgi:AcrR family transcriptional regulator